MKKLFVPLLSLLLMLGSAAAWAENPRVKLETSLGDMVLELYPDKAPATVANFLAYVRDGFYDGTIFHRIIDGFMVQGGGFTPDMQQKETRSPIANEADNGLRNSVGTIAMARTSDPHSATSQFYINVANNTFLDFREKTPRAWGYAVFGKLVDGMSVLGKIKAVKTHTVGPFQNVPAEPVVITKATVIGEEPPAPAPATESAPQSKENQ